MKLSFKHALHMAIIFTLVFFSYWSFGSPIRNKAKQYISRNSPIYKQLDKVIALFMSGKDIDNAKYMCTFSEGMQKEYQSNRPLFLKQLDGYDTFVGYLDAVGLFTYVEMQGYGNRLDLCSWIQKLQAHGAFFLALMDDGVAKDFYKATDKKVKTERGDPIDWLKRARDDGNDAAMWQICEQFGIKGKIYDDIIGIDKGCPSNSIDRYAKSVDK